MTCSVPNAISSEDRDTLSVVVYGGMKFTVVSGRLLMPQVSV